MPAHPTVTVKIREVLAFALGRARKTGRTQQLELGEDLFIRIAGGGDKFLLFQLEGEPSRAYAEQVASALGYRAPRFGWHQGETLRSLTVEDAGEHGETAWAPPTSSS